MKKSKRNKKIILQKNKNHKKQKLKNSVQKINK